MSEGEQCGGTYAVRVCCQNCGDELRALLPRGVAIEDAKCDTCGCVTLKRAMFATGYRS